MSKVILEIFEYSNQPKDARDLLDIFCFVCDKHIEMELFISFMQRHFNIFIPDVSGDVLIYAKPTNYTLFRFQLQQKIKACQIQL